MAAILYLDLRTEQSGTPIGEPLVGHSGEVTLVLFYCNDWRIVSASYDKTVRIWDTDAGGVVAKPLVRHSFWVKSVAISPDGRRIASGSDDQSMRC